MHMHDIQEICFLQVHIYTRRELERGKSGKRGQNKDFANALLGESVTLLRQRENESDKCTRDIISMKREQVGANTQKKIQIQRFTNRNGPSGPCGESANSETKVKFVNAVTAGGSVKFLPAV